MQAAEEAVGPRWAWIPWVLSAAFFLFAAVVPLPQGLLREGAYTLAALGAAVLFWSSGVQDPALTGLLIVSLLALLRVIPFADAVAGFGTEFIWLLAATFILTQAMADVGLGQRIALRILDLARGRSSGVLLALLCAMVVLAFMVPTAAGRVAMLLPVCMGIIEATGIAPTSRFARAMLIGTSHTAIMAGIGLVTAAGATVYAAGAFDSLVGMEWSYVAWLAAFLPLVVVFVLLLWRILLWAFPPERDELTGGAAYVQEELRRMGPLSTGERKMLAVYAGIFALWILGPRWSITTSQAAMLGMLVLLLPGVRLLTWERALAAVRWNIVMLFGITLALAVALERSGAGRWLTDVTLLVLERPSPLAFVLIVAPLVILIRVGFVNNLGMIAAMLPLAFTLAKGWGLNPVWVGMIVVVTAGPGFLLPTQAPSGMITFGYEYYTIRDYMRSGLPASIVLLLLTWAAALFYWPLLGYRP
jgi:anion transporter